MPLARPSDLPTGGCVLLRLLHVYGSEGDRIDYHGWLCRSLRNDPLFTFQSLWRGRGRPGQPKVDHAVVRFAERASFVFAGGARFWIRKTSPLVALPHALRFVVRSIVLHAGEECGDSCIGA